MSSEAISAPAQQELVSPSEPVHSDHTHDPTEVHHIHDRNSAGDPTKPAIVTGHAADNDDDVTAADVDPAKAIFPHSPPDSNKMTKSEASDSELSDLDDDAIDLGPETHSDPVPDPASGPVADPDIDRQHEDIKTEDDDDIGDIEPADWSGQVPIFRPTMDQFKDFKRFMEKIDSYGMKSGIVKIIPPQEWKDSLPKLDELVKHIRVRDPIKQDIMGSNGTYRQVNILHQRSYNLPQWRRLCDQSEHQPPARRGERRAQPDKPKPKPKPRVAADTKTTTTTPAKTRGPGRRGKRKGGRGRPKREIEPEDRPLTPESPRSEDEAPPPIKKEAIASIENDDANMEPDPDDEPASTAGSSSMGRMGRMGRMGGAKKPAKDATQSVSARRKYCRREGSAMIDEEAFKDFDYDMDISEYTPERCEELERAYWKTLTYAPPLYGADLMGTLFDESTEIWNLNKLPNLLDVLGTKVPGVNTAYLYLGMWKATFAWHLEDVDLYSINYLHFGAPKQWYSIAQADLPRFEAAMKNIWPTEAKSCSQFLRHKGFLISPQHLKQHYNIIVNKCVSYPGEFVVTYPYGYHSGYNLGYNCAEAVNFALDSWLPMGKVAKRCECAQAQDSVWVDVYDIERKLRGEETEYEETEEEEDEDEDVDEEMEDVSGLPSPASSHTAKNKPTSRKRKRDAGDKGEVKKKVKKIRLRVKSRPEPICCLCPGDLPGAEVLDTDDGRKAHRMCALYLPETYIDTVDGKEVVANVANINKDRMDLKCLFCRSKRGACFQCSQNKCARAYHATCAAAAGVFVEEAEVPVFGEDGTEYKEQAFEFSCRFHRTKRDRKLDGDALDEDPRIRDAAAALQKGDICQMQYYRGDIFAGVVVENNKSEQTLLLDVIPNRNRVEVEWKWLLLPDPADYRLPKASANALPLPSSQKAKDQLKTRRAVDEIPRKGDQFVDGGFTWAEFNTCDELQGNKDQAKVDLAKDNQVWYYLGRISTEAKSQYTENPMLPRHNPRSNFLASIPKPPKPPKSASQQVHSQQLASYAPQQPSPLANATSAPTSADAAAVNPGKPYVYKPRKPVQPTWNRTSSQAVAEASPVHMQSSSPYPPGQQFQHGTVPRSQGQNVQNGQQTTQFVAPNLVPPSYKSHPTYLAYASSSGLPPATAPASQTPQQARLTPQASQPQQYQHHVPPSQHSQQQNARQGQSQPYQARQDSTTAQQQPTTTTTAAPVSQPRPGPSQPAQPPTQRRTTHASTAQHEPDSSTYRTPYIPSSLGGGFTNGYEGNFRAHLLQCTTAGLYGNVRPASVNNVANSTLQPSPVSGATPHSQPSAPPSLSGRHQYQAGHVASSSDASTAGSAQLGPQAKGQIQNQTQIQAQGMGLPGTRVNSATSHSQHGTTGNAASPAPPVPSHNQDISPHRATVSGNALTQTSSSSSTSHLPTSNAGHGPLDTSNPASIQRHATDDKTLAVSKKPVAPKVQYKIPEKETPVPLPPMYLAAMKRTSTTATSAPSRPSSDQSTGPELNKAGSQSAPSSSTTDGPVSEDTALRATNPPTKAPWVAAETPVPIPQPKGMASMPRARTASTSASPPHSAPPAQETESQSTKQDVPSLQNPSQQQGPRVPQETPVPLPPLPGKATTPSLPPASALAAPPATTYHSHSTSLAVTQETGTTCGLPDVPQDSTALVEQMMANLRRASSKSTAS